jgi:hypothetical protein
MQCWRPYSCILCGADRATGSSIDFQSDHVFDDPGRMRSMLIPNLRNVLLPMSQAAQFSLSCRSLRSASCKRMVVRILLRRFRTLAMPACRLRYSARRVRGPDRNAHGVSARLDRTSMPLEAGGPSTFSNRALTLNQELKKSLPVPICMALERKV